MKKNFMAGVSSLNREYLEEILELMGDTVSGNKGQLTLRIREHVNRCLKSDVSFGKYKGQGLLTALSDVGYQEWCDKKTQKGVGCHRDLLRMVAMARLGRNHYQKKQEKMRLENALKKEELKKEKEKLKPVNPGLQTKTEEFSDPEEGLFYRKREDRRRKLEETSKKEGTASSSDQKSMPQDETAKKEIKPVAKSPMTRAKPEWTGREDWDAYTAQCREWLAEQKQQQPMMSNSEKRK